MANVNILPPKKVVIGHTTKKVLVIKAATITLLCFMSNKNVV